MFRYGKEYIRSKANEMGVVVSSLEKVLRLIDILAFISDRPSLRNDLALKGGTAINLTIFNLPRMSVDLDFDYARNVSKEDMLTNRSNINDELRRYMTSEGYSISPGSKIQHSLDSFKFYFENTSGYRDVLKIEINYSLRSHILPTQIRAISIPEIVSGLDVHTLAPVEIFGSKLTALMSRAAARDLYDVNNMIRFGLFDESEQHLLRQCVVFYCATSAQGLSTISSLDRVHQLTSYKIKTDLYPMLRRSERFNLESSQKQVRDFLDELVKLHDNEVAFLKAFARKQYVPDILFDDPAILERIQYHPMAIWRVRNIPEHIK